MPERARDIYGGANSGSLAYDYSNPALFPEYTIDEPQVEQPQSTTAEGVQRKAQVRARQSISAGAALGYAVSAVLLIYTLMAQIQLTTLSAETVELQERLTELRLEEARLKIAYESEFNFTEIETFAIKELGMQKPNGDQIQYIDSSAPEVAVILQEPEDEIDGVTSKITGWFASILEYFK